MQGAGEAAQQLPPSITELLKIPGLGPKRVRALYDTLEVKSLDQLAKARAAGKIRELEGFGAKTEQTILEALAAHVTAQKRFKLAIAAPVCRTAEEIPGESRRCAAGGDWPAAFGAARRPSAISTSSSRAGAREGDGALHELRRGARGAGQGRDPLDRDPQMRPAGRPARGGPGMLRRGAALFHRLQGAQHRDAPPRAGAQAQAQRVRLFRGEQAQSPAKPRNRSTARVGLPWIAPELRENRGEIEAARAGKLPTLSSSRTCAATCTSTPRPPTATTRCARWPRPRARRARVHRDHRALAPPRGRARAGSRAPAPPDGRDRRAQRRARGHHAPEGHRGRHPRGWSPRPPRRGARRLRPGGRRRAFGLRAAAREADATHPARAGEPEPVDPRAPDRTA